MPRITLPDGSVKQFDDSVAVAQVAESIGKKLAKAALAGKIDGKLVDTSFLIERDAELSIVTNRDDDALELLRHDAAHVMAQAVQELYPGTQVTIGPAIEDGFYYDFAREEPFTPVTPALNLEVMAILESAEKAAKSGRTVTLPKLETS